jgi:predicted CXXCH cytochrome family protein
MGSKRITRFLKRSKDYGKFDILSASCIAQSGSTSLEKLQNVESPHWETRTFADRCAGCHATAVNTQTRAFSATSLDCFACHGDVPLEHTKDVRRVFLSSKNRTPRQVTSICSQCHLRGGKSKSSKLPYPNTFVAGDNLFRDFQVDLSGAAIKALPPIDQHIFLNARDVAVFGNSTMTCLTCHDVHGQSSEKHQRLENATICSSCHVQGTDNTKLRDAILPFSKLQTHSRVCDY